MFTETFEKLSVSQASINKFNRTLKAHKMKNIFSEAAVGSGIGASFSALNNAATSQEKDFKKKLKSLAKSALVGAIGAPVISAVGLKPYSNKTATGIIKARREVIKARKAADPNMIAVRAAMNSPDHAGTVRLNNGRKERMLLRDAEQNLNAIAKKPEMRRKFTGVLAAFLSTVGLSKALED